MPKQLVLADDGNGVTDESLEYFAANVSKMGGIRKLEAWATHCPGQPKSKRNLMGEYNVAIFGTLTASPGVKRRTKMLLSGFSVGYGGTGPYGLFGVLKVLEWRAAFVPTDMDTIASTHHLVVTRKYSAPYDCTEQAQEVADLLNDVPQSDENKTPARRMDAARPYVGPLDCGAEGRCTSARGHVGPHYDGATKTFFPWSSFKAYRDAHDGELSGPGAWEEGTFPYGLTPADETLAKADV